MYSICFSAGEVTRRRASLVPNSGAGPRYRATSERHTHRSGQGGCMLENSGLVLGVDSSLCLLSRLHNPRHVCMALLVHGWLLHLWHKEQNQVTESSSEGHPQERYQI